MPEMTGQEFTPSADSKVRGSPGLVLPLVTSPPTAVQLNSLLSLLPSPTTASLLVVLIDELPKYIVPLVPRIPIDLLSEYVTEEVLKRAIFKPMLGSAAAHDGFPAGIFVVVWDPINIRLFTRLIMTSSPFSMPHLTGNVPSSIPFPSFTHLSSAAFLSSTRLAKFVKELSPGFSNLKSRLSLAAFPRTPISVCSSSSSSSMISP